MFVAETQTFLSCLVLKIYSHHVSPRPSDKYVRQKTDNTAKGENASLVLYLPIVPTAGAEIVCLSGLASTATSTSSAHAVAVPGPSTDREKDALAIPSSASSSFTKLAVAAAGGLRYSTFRSPVPVAGPGLFSFLRS